MHRLAPCAALLVAVAVSGCTTDDSAGSGASTSGPGTSTESAPAPSSAPPSWAGWDEPDDYRFTVQSSCGERSFIGVYRVTVQAGKVTAANHEDQITGGILELEPDELQQVPTLGDLLDDARRATADPGAGEITVETDPADGHPTTVDIDHIENAIDDEACYVVTDYEPSS